MFHFVLMLSNILQSLGEELTVTVNDRLNAHCSIKRPGPNKRPGMFKAAVKTKC